MKIIGNYCNHFYVTIMVDLPVCANYLTETIYLLLKYNYCFYPWIFKAKNIIKHIIIFLIKIPNYSYLPAFLTSQWSPVCPINFKYKTLIHTLLVSLVKANTALMWSTPRNLF